jgi:nucleotide-binding universal stress UspA family protein
MSKFARAIPNLTWIKDIDLVASRLNAHSIGAHMYKKILVPTDGSELSEQAVTAAIEFARLYGAGIVALSVAEPPPILSAEATMAVDLGVETEQRQQSAHQHVDKVAQAAQAAGVPCQTAIAYSAVPHQEIIAAAAANQCDLIFMASHGRRGLSRLLAGSVAQNVMAYSPMAVMVLRPPIQEHHSPVHGTRAAAS